MKSSVKVVCSTCSLENVRGGQFCINCGEDLRLDEQSVPDVQYASADSTQSLTQPGKRNGLLTSYLLATIIGGLLMATSFFASDAFAKTNDRGLFFFGTVVGGLALAGAGVGLWRWQRWGFDLFVTATIGIAVVFMLLGQELWLLIPLLGSVALLYVLLQPHWQYLNRRSEE